MYKNKDDKIKYYSIVEYYDIETGEEITKNEFEKNYIKIKNIKVNKVYEQDKKNKCVIIRHRNACRRSGKQLGFKF